MSNRVDSMTPVERAAWGIVFALDSAACDARNDAPWKAMRDVHRTWIENEHRDLGEALRQQFGQLSDDELDALYGMDSPVPPTGDGTEGGGE